MLPEKMKKIYFFDLLKVTFFHLNRLNKQKRSLEISLSFYKKASYEK